MGKYVDKGNEVTETYYFRAITNELAEANRLKRIELQHGEYGLADSFLKELEDQG